MIKIKSIPVGYPSQEANGINIRIMPFQTNATNCSTYYELLSVVTVISEEGGEREVVKSLADGNSPITTEQFSEWADDNEFIENIVLENLGLERL